MKLIRGLLAASLLLLPVGANATELLKYQPGPRLIDGSQLNKMVAIINAMQGSAGGTPTSGYFSLNTTGTTGPTPAVGTVLQVVGANAAAAARIEVDAFGGVPVVSVRRANGTKAAPTALVSGDEIGTFNYHGASTSALYYGPAAATRAYATENWSGTAGGSKFVISTTPNTTHTLTDALTVGQDQSLTVVGSYLAVPAATTSSAGGAITMVAAAGGSASGTGGAVNVTAGAGTAGAGGAVVITGGAGGAATNAGGNVNLVGGAPVSTGIPGEVQFNGNSSITCASYYFTGTPAATDTVFFIATRAFRVKTISEVHAVAAGGASVLQVVKDTGTAAPGAGTDLLTNNTNTGFDLNATANTVQVGTLSATVATNTLAAGDRLSVDFANTIQSSSGVVVTACMSPV